MAATMPLRPAATQSPSARLIVLDEPKPIQYRPAAPTVLLVAEWQSAVLEARPGAAAGYRRLVDAIADEEPTWEDAEWQ